MDNYIGRMLDNRYEILEMIGSGGMAVVYKARCHRLNRLVAIKILKDELSQDEEFRRRFHAESQAVAMLSHPNIVNVYDVSRSGDVDYIVMELIDGITLKQYMEQKGVLNWREVLHFATQIAKALEHAHSRGIIHRDIKPHNIMLLKDGSVKVADFGIARISSAQNTLTREALGSVHYISPEQAKGSRVDERTDLYSLGVVMYEMLTGRPPFDGDSPVSVAIQHINATPVLPSEINPEIPLGLEQITMHAMTAQIEKRYESATKMLEDLEEFRKKPNIVFAYTKPELSPAARAEERSVAAPANRTAVREHRTVPSTKVKSSPAAIGLAIACILLAVAGIGYFLYTYLVEDIMTQTEDVTVPSFVGELYEDIDVESYVDFDIMIEEWVTSDTVPYGRVIRQDPEANKTVKAGSEILLTVSLGVQSDTMPSLVGETEDKARQILSDLDVAVTISTIYAYDDEIEEDIVMETSPASGETLEAGQLVTLTVSQGQETKLVEVPALIGMDVEKALESIDKAGLERGDIRYVESELPKDTVTFQSLEQGNEVKPGTVINLQASLGPEEDPDEEDTNNSEEPQNPDAPDDSETGDQPDKDPTSDPGGTTNPPVTPEDGKKEKTITVKLPEGKGNTMITIKIDGEAYGTPFAMDLEARTVDVVVKGSGRQTVDIYFDGVLGETQTVDFG